MVELKHNEKFVADIGKLARIREEGWHFLLSKIESIAPTTRFPEEVSNVVKASVQQRPELFESVPGDELSRIIRGLMYLRITKEQLSGELLRQISDVVVVAYSGVHERDSIFRPEITFEKLNENVKNLLGSENLYLSAKAYILSGEYDQILGESRILTDVRPIFAESESVGIMGYFINHVLRLKTYRGDDEEIVNISLDSSDLEHLMLQIARAKQKSQAIQISLDGGALGDRVGDGE